MAVNLIYVLHLFFPNYLALFDGTKYPFHYLVVSFLLIKVGVLRPVQQPGSYWDRSSELPLVGLEPTEVTAYD